MERSTISNRSSKLFTLSSIKSASRALLKKQLRQGVSEEERLLAKEYWECVAANLPDWQRARTKRVATADLRQNYVHAHGVALHALGVVGARLLAERPRDWKTDLKKLGRLDWSRSNLKLWEGRAMVHGRISKATASVQLTANAIKKTLGLALSGEETLIENKRGQS
jgi:DNA sulfur modification protein DndB